MTPIDQEKGFESNSHKNIRRNVGFRRARSDFPGISEIQTVRSKPSDCRRFWKSADPCGSLDQIPVEGPEFIRILAQRQVQGVGEIHAFIEPFQGPGQSVRLRRMEVGQTQDVSEPL